MNNRLNRYLWIASAVCTLLFANSCGEKKRGEERFATPGKTYAVWVETAVTGDFATNIECVTKASRRFMDNQVKHRAVFMERMMQSAAIYSNYSVTAENIKGGKAVVVIRDPESGASIAVPFLYEEGGWKADLIAMFSGMVAAGQ